MHVTNVVTVVRIEVLGRSAMPNLAPERRVFLWIRMLVEPVVQVRNGLDKRQASSVGLRRSRFFVVLAVFDVPNGQVVQFPDPGTSFVQQPDECLIAGMLRGVSLRFNVFLREQVLRQCVTVADYC